MLQAIRSKASSLVVKLLFGLLIVTFGVWGIGDIFRQTDADAPVAKVGGRAITMSQMTVQVQKEIDRLKQLIGSSVDSAQAKQLGVVDQALQRLIGDDLVALEISRMGLAVGDDAVHDAIIANPAFHDQAGKFDRNVYLQVLASNRLTDAQYQTLQRSDLLRQQLTGAVIDGVTPPKELVEAIYRTRAEHRVADVVQLPLTAGNINPTPTDEQVAAFYHAHEDKFQSPERRSFKVAMLRIDDVAAGIELTDEQLKHEYDARPDEFSTAEQRHLKQMLLPDEAAAKEAETQLAAGKDFAAVAKDVAKMDDPASLDLGFVAQADLPPELADPAFAMKEGDTTPPINTSFGWHILRLEGIKAAEVQTFDQVKDKLKQEVARDRASDRVADLANNIDDAIAGGMSLDAVAEKFQLKTLSADDVDSDGKDSSGKAFDLPQNAPAVLHTAFATDKGQTSSLTELGEDGYFIVQVAKIVPAATKPLADVHDDAVSQWQAEQREQAVTKIAEEIAAEVKDGKTLRDVATERHLGVIATQPMQRNSHSQQLTDQFVGKVFDAKPNGIVIDVGAAMVNVAQVTSIEPGDPSKDQAGFKRLSQELGQVMQGDVLGEYDQALRRTYPVEVDQSNLDHVL